jgi:hypothetical protein
VSGPSGPFVSRVEVAERIARDFDPEALLASQLRVAERNRTQYATRIAARPLRSGDGLEVVKRLLLAVSPWSFGDPEWRELCVRSEWSILTRRLPGYAWVDGHVRVACPMAGCDGWLVEAKGVSGKGIFFGCTCFPSETGEGCPGRLMSLAHRLAKHEAVKAYLLGASSTHSIIFTSRSSDGAWEPYAGHGDGWEGAYVLNEEVSGTWLMPGPHLEEGKLRWFSPEAAQRIVSEWKREPAEQTEPAPRARPRTVVRPSVPGEPTIDALRARYRSDRAPSW